LKRTNLARLLQKNFFATVNFIVLAELRAVFMSSAMEIGRTLPIVRSELNSPSVVKPVNNDEMIVKVRIEIFYCAYF
jgi:hypothetical protein